MKRNDAGTPFAAMLFAGLLLAAARMGALRGLGPTAGHLTVFQVGALTFAVVLLVYAAIGLLSVGLEGRELRPGMHPAPGGRGALAAVLLLCVALVSAAGLLVHTVFFELLHRAADPRLEGGLLGSLFGLAAVLLAVVGRSFLRREALLEDARSEVPW
jgi:hypothetical protein